MAFDVNQEVAQLQDAFTNWLAGVFGDEGKALAFAQDPYGELDDAGFTNQNLANLNVQQAVAQACTAPGVPPYVQENLQGYGGPSYNGPPTIEHVVEQVQQVTQIVYQDNDVINTEIQNNNTNVNVGDNFNGDIDVDNLNVDDGGVGNTGDGFSGQQNSGDNAVQNQGTIEGGVVAGNNDGIVTGQGSTVENAVTGTGNTVGAQVQDGGSVDDLAFATGSGNVTQLNESPLTNSAVGGEDVTNIGGNEIGPGAAIATGDGDASGHFEDNDTDQSQHFTSNITGAEQVNVEQAGHDGGDQSNDFGDDPDPVLH